MSFIFDASKGETPESVARRRRIADALMQAGTSTEPVQHWSQGANRMLRGLLGGYLARRADEAERTGRSSAYAGIVSALMNGPGGQSAAAPAQTASSSNPYGNAISSIESGGRYDALGPVTRTGDRAYGKYQVMGANIGPWTREALGREVTSQEFVASPEIQDAVFNAKFGSYAQKYGPEGAARAWFAGEGGMNDPNRRDQLGTTVSAYADKFNRALGPQVASADPSIGVGSVQPQPQPTELTPDQRIAQAMIEAQRNRPAAPQQAISPQMQRIMAAASNPWVPEAQRGILKALMQRELQQNDPMRRLQMENIQSQIDHRRSQHAQGGGVYGTPIYGRDPETGQNVVGAIGRDGTFRRLDTGGVQVTPGVTWQDFGTHRQAFDRAGQPVGPAVTRHGDVPAGHVQTPTGVAPMGGSPQERQADEALREAAERERKQSDRSAQTLATGQLIRGEISRVRERVKNAPFYNPAVGFGSDAASWIRGSNAADVAQLTETIKANIGFDRLQRMREESPTGGALGQVAVQELVALQSTLGSLSQAQSKEQFLENLDRLERMYDGILRKASAYPNAAKYGFAAVPATGNAPQPASPTSSASDPMGLR